MVKSKFVALLICCLLIASCTEPTPLPVVSERPATLVSSSPQAPLTVAPPLRVTLLPSSTPPEATTVPPVYPAGISPENVDQVALLSRFGGKGQIRHLSYLPDGKTLAIGTTLGVYFYDTQAGQEIGWLDAADRRVDLSISPIAFNRQGELLALERRQADDDCHLVVWRFSGSTWQQAGEVPADVECLAEALSPDGEYLASANYNQRLVTVWRTEDMSPLRTFPLEYPGDIFSIFVQLAFSGEGTLAVAEASYVSVYDLPTGNLLQRLEMPGMTSLNWLAISQDGQVLAARDQGTSRVAVWKLGDGDVLTLDDVAEDWLSGAILLSPDGALVAFGHSGSSSGEAIGWVDLWRTSDGQALPRLKKPGWFYPPPMTFTPDGALLITGEDGLDFWRVNHGELVSSLSGYQGVEGALSPDGSLLAEATWQHIRLYRLRDGQVVRTLEEEDGASGPAALVFSPDGSLLVSQRIPGELRLWDVRSGTLKETVEYKCSTSHWSNQVRFSSDGQFLALYTSSSRCRGIAVWRVGDGKRLYEFAGAGGDSFAISPDGKILVVEDENAGAISLARLQDGAILQTIQRPGEEGLLSSFSPAGQSYALGAMGSDIRAWQIGQDEPLYTVQVGPFEWTALAFSPGGEYLVLASDAVQVRKASDGALLYTLPAQYSIRPGRLFSPDGAFLVTSDGTAYQLWRASDGRLLYTLESAPLFSPDGSLLATWHAGAIQLWRASDGALLRTLEDAAYPVAFSSDGQTLVAVRDGVVEAWGVVAP